MDPDLPLVQRLRAGEPAALEEAYRRHGASVYRLCLRTLGRAADAEDAVQEVFLKVLERARSFAGESRLATWLHSVAVNTCLHRLERERLRGAEGLPPEGGPPARADDDPEARASSAEEREGLERLLARLSPEHRVALVLREVEGLAYRDIAAALSIPVGTVMSRLARAREQLARLAGARHRGPLTQVTP